MSTSCAADLYWLSSANLSAEARRRSETLSVASTRGLGLSSLSIFCVSVSVSSRGSASAWRSADDFNCGDCESAAMELSDRMRIVFHIIIYPLGRLQARRIARGYKIHFY